MIWIERRLERLCDWLGEHAVALVRSRSWWRRGAGLLLAALALWALVWLALVWFLFGTKPPADDAEVTREQLRAEAQALLDEHAAGISLEEAYARVQREEFYPGTYLAQRIHEIGWLLRLDEKRRSP